MSNDGNSPKLIWPDEGNSGKLEPRRSTIRSQAARWSHREDKSRKGWGMLTWRSTCEKCGLPKSPTPGTTQKCTCKESQPTSPAVTPSTEPSFDRQAFLFGITPIVGRRAAAWISDVVNAYEDGSLVQHSISTLAQGLNSRSSGLQADRDASIQRYIQILAQVQQLLSQPIASDTIHEMVTIAFMMSWIELIVWDDPWKWMMHLDGITNILATHDASGFSHSSFFIWLRELYYYVLVLDLFRRRTSFLMSQQWQNIPWPTTTDKTLVDTILDLLIHFPGLYEKLDTSVQNPALLEELDEDIQQFISNLDEWREESGVETEADLERLVSYLVQSETDDAETVYAFTLYLSAWLLISGLGDEYAQYLPRPRIDIITDITRLCRRYLGQEQEIGLIKWTLPIRLALLTPVDATIPEVEAFRSQLESQPAYAFIGAVVTRLPGLGVKTEFMDSERGAAP